MKLSDALYKLYDKEKLLEILEDSYYFDLAVEFCFHTPKEKLSEKCINKFNEIKDKLKEEKIINKIKKNKISLVVKPEEEYLKLISECENIIKRGESSEEFKEKIIRLYDKVLYPVLKSESGYLWRPTDPELVDIEINMKILRLLAQIEDVCLMLKRFKDFNIKKNNLRDLIWFIERLFNLNYFYKENVIKAIDIPENDSISCLLHLYKLFKSLGSEYKFPDFLLLLSVTSEVLKNEGLSAEGIDRYIQIFKKVFKNVCEKIPISKEEELRNLRECLVSYLLSALKVSRTFSIDNEMNYHAYIVSKFSNISVKNFREFTNLYEKIVNELVKKKEYGRRYVLALLRLTAIATIQRIYRMSPTYINSNFIQNLLEIIKFVNETCDKEVIMNFDKMLNYSIYFADLEYLDGFIDFLYSLYLQRNYEEFKNVLRSLNLL